MSHIKSSSKKGYKVINWPEYNKALKQRGSLSVWIAKDIEQTWYADKNKNKKRGRQLKYSHTAIEMLLTLRSLFKLPLRQIEGLGKSLFEFGGINLQVPEFSRLSKRSSKALSRIKFPELQEASYLIIDSTGLKVYGESEWLENKHGRQYKRKIWRKVHIAINPEGLIVREVMTDHLTDDRQCVSSLIKQPTAGLIREVIADRGYDSKAIYDLLESKGIKTIIPLPSKITALQNPTTARDYNLAYIQNKGIHAWYTKNGYRRREKVENLFYRYKTIIGRKLQSRKWQNQEAEILLGCFILNKMTELGMPVSIKVT